MSHWRTVVRIEDVKDGVVTAVLSSWKPDKSVTFPLAQIDEPARAKARRGVRMFAYANLKARWPCELQLREFEPKKSSGTLKVKLAYKDRSRPFPKTDPSA